MDLVSATLVARLNENLCLISSMIKNSKKFGSNKNRLVNYAKNILVTFDQLLEQFWNIQYSLRLPLSKRLHCPPGV